MMWLQGVTATGPSQADKLGHLNMPGAPGGLKVHFIFYKRLVNLQLRNKYRELITLALWGTSCYSFISDADAVLAGRGLECTRSQWD